jgi:hypothetical protein
MQEQQRLLLPVAQQQQQRTLQRQQQQQQQQQQEAPAPKGPQAAAAQERSPPPKQQHVLYRVRVASPEAAERLVSPTSKLALHKSAHPTIYVEPWLTLSQQQARRNMRSTIQQLQQQRIRWRWSLAQPTQLQQRICGPDNRWRWQVVYPAPPSH